jgi:hypothetical protein
MKGKNEAFDRKEKGWRKSNKNKIRTELNNGRDR